MEISVNAYKALEPYYHHSAHMEKDAMKYDCYYAKPYAGRFGVGLIVYMPYSFEYKYFIFPDSKFKMERTKKDKED